KELDGEWVRLPGNIGKATVVAAWERELKSTDVYKEIRRVIGPWAKKQGFTRTTSGMLGWKRPLGNEHLVFWFQCSQSGWDDYAGSKFTVEFQRSETDFIGYAVCRHRLGFFQSLRT